MSDLRTKANKKKAGLSLLGIFAILAGIATWIILSLFYDFGFQPQNIKRGLDLNGGVSITYEVVDQKSLTDSQMDDTVEKFKKRAEAFSTESNVYKEGKYRINIDIPGADDAQQVLNKLGSAGKIYFIYAQDSNGTSNVIANADGTFSLARSMDQIIKDGDVVVDGNMVSDAKEQSLTDTNGTNKVVVQLRFNGQGIAAFSKATSWCCTQSGMKNKIAIVYDDEIVSCPGVSTAITDGEAIIEGEFSMAEAGELATIIRIGALPVDVTPIRSNIVGATLGTNALRTSLIAGLIGFILVCIFMIVIYRLPGLAASISLIMYMGITLALLLVFEVTLTLPGIAGIILSVGMAVDANVIIFTRIREEIANGKTARSAMKLGYEKATSAIVDGNVTTLIAALVLYAFGSGVIKGFAITLGIGIVVSMFSGLILTRWIMSCFLNLGAEKPSLYGKESHKKNLKIVEHGKIFAIISGAIIVLGIVMLFVNKAKTGEPLNYGLDFVGGSSIQVNFKDKAPEKTEIEKLVKDTINETCSISEVRDENALIIKTRAFLEGNSAIDKLEAALNNAYQLNKDNYLVDNSADTTSIKVTFANEVPEISAFESIIAGAIDVPCKVETVEGEEKSLLIKAEQKLASDNALSSLTKALRDKYNVYDQDIETETISGTVSGEMKKDAIVAVCIAAVCMLLYIWIRFRNLAVASSAVIALIHDVLVVFALYSVCRITVDTSFIACMLTLVGYSINATIVIFDRIRENLVGKSDKVSLKDIVNKSISETFTRSLNTSITTLLTVVVLIILGVDSVRIFAIPLAFGLVCGTYSSICITGTLWYAFKKKGVKAKTK